MLAVKADYKTGLARIGTKRGNQLSSVEILAALKSIGYSGELVKDTL